jgi:acetyl-CoA carboxylase carboxyltransferase component
MVWMTSVSKGEILHQTSDMIGTTFRETVEEDGKGIEMHGVITGYEPDKSISFHIESQINVVDVEYSIEGTHNGVCLTQKGIVHWKFPMNVISIIIGGKIRQNIIAQSREELDRLKKLSEGYVQAITDAGGKSTSKG